MNYYWLCTITVTVIALLACAIDCLPRERGRVQSNKQNPDRDPVPAPSSAPAKELSKK